jgi:hypothetical protein
MKPIEAPAVRAMLIYAAVLLISLTAARGLFRTGLLAGHDAAAYPVTQHQFHENIRAGVLFPRWAPDMRHGYGHIKLQYRPPLLHWLAEPVYAVSGNAFAAINAALILSMIGAGFGMYALGRTYVGRPAALVGVCAYVGFNYVLANLYLRGAYYEVAAYACMPWVLWAQARIFATPRANGCTAAAGLAWAALACGHPQTMTLFIPLALAHAAFSWNEHRSAAGLTGAAVGVLGGLLLAAPYLYVAYRELPFVRMELFYTGLEAYTQHFISLKTLVTESWPAAYRTYAWVDYLGRPRHLEMRGLNGWALFLMAGTPLLWFGPGRLQGAARRRSLFVYICLLGSILLLLPFAGGIWSALPLLHTFNFPWRVLGVTGLCLGMLAGLTAQAVMRIPRLKNHGALLCAAIILLMAVGTWHHGHGWPDTGGCSRSDITQAAIVKNPGIPKQFYTPRWVSRYATRPPAQAARVIRGTATVRVENKNPITWQLSINAATAATIAVSHYFYPGWQVTGLGRSAVTPGSLWPTGEMIFNVPAGSHRVRLHFGLTRDRLWGYAMGMIGLLLLLTAGAAGKGVRHRAGDKPPRRKHQRCPR